MVETTRGYMFARVVEEKAYRGQYDQKVTMVEDFLKDLGKREYTLQCGGESTLISLIARLADHLAPNEGSAIVQINATYTSPHSSNSNGSVERAIRLIRDQLRVMFGHITHKLNVVFAPKTKFIPWLVRHVCWIINRCIQKSNGKTRYEDMFKREFRKVKHISQVK